MSIFRAHQILYVLIAIGTSLAAGKDEKGIKSWETDSKLNKILKRTYEKFHKADPEKYLAIARLIKDDQDHCLATVADHDWILTAAHCVEEFTNSQDMGRLRVIAGDFTGASRDAAEQKLNVTDIVIHEDYRGKGRRFNDIALLRVAPSIMFNSYIVPVNFPDGKFGRSLPRPGTAYVTTWLPLASNANTGELVELTVQVLKKDQCLKRLSQEQRHVGKARFCSVDSFNAAACFGSQADPVFVSADDGTVYQVGIVNQGNCGSELAIHTKIANFVGWIDQKIAGCTKSLPETGSLEQK